MPILRSIQRNLGIRNPRDMHDASVLGKKLGLPCDGMLERVVNQLEATHGLDCLEFVEDRVDIILANPPFGGKEEDGIEANFPQHFRTKETADLFLALFILSLFAELIANAD